MVDVDTFLKSVDGYSWLHKHYIELEWSSYQIAKELGTYPNKVLRAIKSHKIPTRSHSKAQETALKKGRSSHPTKGSKRSKKTRALISEGLAKNWENLSDEERAERKRVASERWENMPEETRKMIRESAGQGMSRAAREGSQIEHVLLTALQAAGYQARHHHETLLGNENMHLDIWLPELTLAIEIDGPTHFLPIYGEERLEKTQLADAEKTGLILSYGYRLIRIKYLLKTLSKYRERVVIEDLLRVLDCIKDGTISERYMEIEVSVDGQKTRDEENGDN